MPECYEVAQNWLIDSGHQDLYDDNDARMRERIIKPSFVSKNLNAERYHNVLQDKSSPILAKREGN